MSEKKGVQLPGRDGRWEEMCDLVNGSDVGSWDHTIRVRPAEEYVIYRRLPNPRTKPLPVLVQGDGLMLSTLGESHVVVVNQRLKIAADTTGRWIEYLHDHILEVWRDGEKIWDRGDG
jgi:hypothetical protein